MRDGALAINYLELIPSSVLSDVLVPLLGTQEIAFLRQCSRYLHRVVSDVVRTVILCSEFAHARVVNWDDIFPNLCRLGLKVTDRSQVNDVKAFLQAGRTQLQKLVSLDISWDSSCVTTGQDHLGPGAPGLSRDSVCSMLLKELSLECCPVRSLSINVYGEKAVRDYLKVVAAGLGGDFAATKMSHMPDSLCPSGSGGPWEDEELQNCFNAVTHLHLGGCSIDGADILTIATSHNRLNTLRCQMGAEFGANFHLPSLPIGVGAHVKELSMELVGTFTDADFGVIPHCFPNIQQLTVDARMVRWPVSIYRGSRILPSPLTSGALTSLLPLVSLTSLTILGWSGLKHEDVVPLTHLPSLNISLESPPCVVG